jgi:hypothetical protein
MSHPAHPAHRAHLIIGRKVRSRRIWFIKSLDSRTVGAEGLVSEPSGPGAGAFDVAGPPLARLG